MPLWRRANAAVVWTLPLMLRELRLRTTFVIHICWQHAHCFDDIAASTYSKRTRGGTPVLKQHAGCIANL